MSLVKFSFFLLLACLFLNAAIASRWYSSSNQVPGQLSMPGPYSSNQCQSRFGGMARCVPGAEACPYGTEDAASFGLCTSMMNKCCKPNLGFHGPPAPPALGELKLDRPAFFMPSSTCGDRSLVEPLPQTPTGDLKPDPTGQLGWLTRVGPYQVEKLGIKDSVYIRDHKKKVTKFVLHSTENKYWDNPAYSAYNIDTVTLNAGKKWPHFIVGRVKGEMRIGQYLSLNKASRALKSGNDQGMIQVEVCGLASKPFTDDHETAKAVGMLWRALSAYTGCDIPLTVGKPFAGLNAGETLKTPAFNARLRANRCKTQDEFLSLTGLIGHQHSPAPDTHWDPGHIDPQKLLDASSAVNL